MRFWILLIGGLLWTMAPARAFQYGAFVSCNGINRRPVVRLWTSYGQLVHDLSHDTQYINGLSQKNPEEGLTTVGLAAIQDYYTIGLKGFSVKLDQQYSCVMASEIDIFIGYKDPVIYVTNQYPKDSCEFSHTLRHEQTHQRINKLTLEYYLPIIDEAIRKAIYDVRAVKTLTDDPERDKKGTDLLLRYYTARLEPLLQEFLAARKREQQKLDNMSNYQMEWKICPLFEERKARAKLAQ